MADDIDWSQLSPKEFKRINQEIRAKAKAELKKGHALEYIHKHLHDLHNKIKQWKIDHPDKQKKYKRKYESKYPEVQKSYIRYSRALRENKLEEELNISLMTVKRIRKYLLHHGGKDENDGT